MQKLADAVESLNGVERVKEGVVRLSRLMHPYRSEQDMRQAMLDAQNIASNVLRGKTWDGKE